MSGLQDLHFFFLVLTVNILTRTRLTTFTEIETKTEFIAYLLLSRKRRLLKNNGPRLRLGP